MISDKTFTIDEFHAKIKDFAQAFINKIGNPDVVLNLVPEGPNSYLIILDKPKGRESYAITLNNKGNVETISVYGQ